MGVGAGRRGRVAAALACPRYPDGALGCQQGSGLRASGDWVAVPSGGAPQAGSVPYLVGIWPLPYLYRGCVALGLPLMPVLATG